MVIKTILDTDLYKFTTSYAYIKLFPYAMGTFTFKERDDTEYTEGFLQALKTELQNLNGFLLSVLIRPASMSIWMNSVICTWK